LLDHFVGMVARYAAKLMGAACAGAHWRSDANIVVLDTGLEKTVRSADLDQTNYTPWECHVVTAWPSVTVLRGKLMVEGGQFFGDPRDGLFVPRKAADDISHPPGRLASGTVVRQATRRAVASIIRRELLAFAYSPASPKAEAVRGPQVGSRRMVHVGRQTHDVGSPCRDVHFPVGRYEQSSDQAGKSWRQCVKFVI
jgi:hypothetical protein